MKRKCQEEENGESSGRGRSKSQRREEGVVELASALQARPWDLKAGMILEVNLRNFWWNERLQQTAGVVRTGDGLQPQVGCFPSVLAELVLDLPDFILERYGFLDQLEADDRLQPCGVRRLLLALYSVQVTAANPCPPPTRFYALTQVPPLPCSPPLPASTLPHPTNRPLLHELTL